MASSVEPVLPVPEFFGAISKQLFVSGNLGNESFCRQFVRVEV